MLLVRPRTVLASLSLALVAMTPALAGGGDGAEPQPSKKPEWIETLAKDPESPRMRAYAEQQRRRIAVEKDLKRLRFEHFRKVRTPEAREQGLAKLRAYTDPAIYPSLIELFGDEEAPVREGLIEQFASLKSVDGDTCLAWLAVFNGHADTRASAAARVVSRSKDAGGISDGGRLTILHAIANGSDAPAGAASRLAGTLGILEAIPLMINAQLGGGGAATGGGATGEGQGDLAYIVVGTQQAYVSDLQPVVADSAVAFDPTLSVITSGTVLRIHDATVTEHRGVIHTALVDFTSRESGRDTSALAYNIPAWNEWYAKEFKPALEARARERAAKAGAATGEGRGAKPGANAVK